MTLNIAHIRDLPAKLCFGDSKIGAADVAVANKHFSNY